MMDDLLKPAPSDALSVTDLTRRIKTVIERGFRQVWVKGEVSNLRRQSSGHIYFSLKDAGSQVPCVLFARDAAQQNVVLDDGMEVLLFGNLAVYEPHGRYQLIAKIALESGLGRLQQAYERLKRKLHAEGLFAAERKRPLPRLPRHLAVVTSPTGAALRDFLRILKRRGFTGRVTVLPAKVQGEGAPAELRSMLGQAAAIPGVDLIVLTRGGGSIEDLWAFNDEALARAVAESARPVLSAIGHEIDTVLTDYAADLRAETPSGAAELISTAYLESVRTVEDLGTRLGDGASGLLDEHRAELLGLHHRLRYIDPARKTQNLALRLDDMEHRLVRSLSVRLSSLDRRLRARAESLGARHPRAIMAAASERLEGRRARLEKALADSVKRKNERLGQLGLRLKNGSLQSSMDRGYAVLKSPSGSILPSAAALAAEKNAVAWFSDGEVELAIKNRSKAPPGRTET